MADHKSRKNKVPDTRPAAPGEPQNGAAAGSAPAPGPDAAAAAAAEAGSTPELAPPPTRTDPAPATPRTPTGSGASARAATGRVAAESGSPGRHPPAAAGAATARRSGAAMLALLLALLAVALGGYAAWRVLLLERADGNRYSSLGQQLDALDVRLAETDRRAARSNELAATLREQLGENERLQARLREDLLALADRNARSESLLAEMARGQHAARQQLALADAVALVSQAELRLRLFADRQTASAALALAEDNLARLGGSHADLRHAVADARTRLADDPLPSTAALLRELDAVAAGLDGLAVRLQRPPGEAAGGAAGGWWARQFARLDRLVAIRHEDEEAGAGMMPSRDGVRRALQRAHLAALGNDLENLPGALRTLRAALVACCDPDSAADALARLDRLLAVDWTAPLPDLAALRARLEDVAVIGQQPATGPRPAAEAGAGTDNPEQEEDGP